MSNAGHAVGVRSILVTVYSYPCTDPSRGIGV